MSQPSKKVQPTANLSGKQRRMHSGSVPGVGSMGVPTTCTGPHAADLDTLRKIAEQATPGPWEVDGPANAGPDDTLVLHNNDGGAIAYVQPLWDDATHIATFDPPTVLSLITRLEQAEQLVQINNQAMLEQTQRAEQAEQAVARVREVIHQYDPDCLTCMCNSDGDCCKCTVADFQEALDGDTRG